MSDDPRTTELERVIDATLRDLPPRRAPATLEPRVLQQLEQRAAGLWWRRSFTHWPPAARAAFAVLCAVLGGLTVVRGGALSAWSDARVGAVWSMVSSSTELTHLIIDAIPSTWLYGGLAAAGILYAALFGLGAFAYRMLYLNPVSPR